MTCSSWPASTCCGNASSPEESARNQRTSYPEGSRANAGKSDMPHFTCSAGPVLAPASGVACGFTGSATKGISQ
eukprot:409423-Prymnesium_polylepis.1